MKWTLSLTQSYKIDLWDDVSTHLYTIKYSYIVNMRSSTINNHNKKYLSKLIIIIKIEIITTYFQFL